MAADPVALLKTINELRAQVEQSAGMVGPELLGRLKGLADEVRAAATEARGALEAEILAKAEALKAKAAAMAPPPPPPAAPPPATPHPWEDHQGLDSGQLQSMVEALSHLAKAPQKGKP